MGPWKSDGNGKWNEYYKSVLRSSDNSGINKNRFDISKKIIKIRSQWITLIPILIMMERFPH
jgi:hypothetical protein